MVVVAVIIVMKCVSAQRKKTLHESSVSQTSQAKELEFTNKIHRESAWLNSDTKESKQYDQWSKQISYISIVHLKG